ncbi:hypothetical protein AUP43_16775 [Oceanibaculum pacificum]|uniref:Toluene tolerance protein n=2 Tax=Oceanibaculum pacificum TaxID=580166 RepID=A0A154WFP3_9PROT|nr:hypothetical protein AUP43_16775 [Oceanibaculum pacificum]
MAVAAFGCMIALSPASPAQADNPQKATTFIQELGGKAIDTITDKSLAEEERLSKFRTLLNQNFDVPGIGRFVLGRYWRTATPEQQQEYLKLFEESIVRTYAARFREYSGEKLAVDNARADGDRFMLVDSKIQRPSGPPVAVTWRLFNDNGGFKIVDVVVEGVSMSVTQRSDYSSVIQSNGGNFDALLKAMRERLSRV